MNYKEQNAEVKRLWEASGRKARVECLHERWESQAWSLIETPRWLDDFQYRIHPDDAHLCQPAIPRICSKHQDKDPLCPLCNPKEKEATYAGPTRCEHGQLPLHCMTCHAKPQLCKECEEAFAYNISYHAEKDRKLKECSVHGLNRLTPSALPAPDPWAYAKSIFDGDARGVPVEIQKDNGIWEVCHSWQLWSAKALNDPTKVRIRPEPEKVKVEIWREARGERFCCLANSHAFTSGKWTLLKTVDVEL